jgi:hypothetical protein
MAHCVGRDAEKDVTDDDIATYHVFSMRLGTSDLCNGSSKITLVSLKVRKAGIAAG